MNFWPTVLTGIPDPELVFGFFHHIWWCVFWKIRTTWIQLLRIRCWKWRCWSCKNVSRHSLPCVSQMLDGPFSRLGIPKYKLNIPPRSGNVGMSTAWSSSTLKISRIKHAIDFILYFLNLGCELKDSVSIFDQFSLRNCIECSRALKSLQFFHLIETFLMSFTKIPILSQFLFIK